MLISILPGSQVGFEQLLIGILALNALIIGVLTFVPSLHGRLVQWIWPKQSGRN